VAHQVHEFEHSEKACKDKGQLVGDPSRGSIVRMQEEVHIDEAKNEPVVATILEEIEERHGVV
jgi:hypothetical protein